jgi:hypothetical protein
MYEVVLIHAYLHCARINIIKYGASALAPSTKETYSSSWSRVNNILTIAFPICSYLYLNIRHLGMTPDSPRQLVLQS